jgi:predicted transport protein
MFRLQYSIRKFIKLEKSIEEGEEKLKKFYIALKRKNILKVMVKSRALHLIGLPL